MAVLLDETFIGPGLHPGLVWLNEPAHWRSGDGKPGLTIRPDALTDFWQRTHYGFVADNGHALLAMVTGNVRVETRVRVRGLNQYDQAGLMVRITPECWLKTSVEFETDAPNRLGAVVTRMGYSDWSTQDLSPHIEDFVFRVTRTAGDFLVEASIAGSPFTQLRLAHLDAARPDENGQWPPAYMGLYACSPRAAGFEAHFDYLRIETVPETHG